MTTIALGGLSEEDFRRSIENRLRENKAAVAAERLRALLQPYAGPGKILPERFLTVTPSDLCLTGWDRLEAAIAAHDRPGSPITAVTIAFGWQGEDLPQPDADGRLKPYIETGYLTDGAYPFSQSTRDDLLDGYSFHGCTWAADYEAVETPIGLDGIDDLQGALTALEARLLASEEPEVDELCAGSLGACLLSVLLHQAVAAKIASAGLPRPLCVMAGSSGVYPYFDAPVVGFPEEAIAAEEPEEELVDAGVPVPRYSSLLVTGIPRARKRAVLVLEENEQEVAARVARLRGLPEAPPEEPAPPSWSEPLPEAPSEPLGEVPVPAEDYSPLLAKKSGGKAWDFRDLLGPPPEDEEPASEAPPADRPLAPEPFDGPPPAELSDHSEPDFTPEPAAQFRDEPLENDSLEPGFTVFEPNIQEQLEALIARQFESVPPAEPAPPPVDDPVDEWSTALVWTEVPPEELVAEPPARRSLLGRLADWVSGRLRRQPR